MHRRPHVDWALARGLAMPQLRHLPEATRAEAAAVVASLRLAARRAGELARDASRLPGQPTANVLVTDRATWVDAVSVMVGHAISELPLGVPRPGLRQRVAGLGYGMVGGVALGLVGRRLLGQFDPFSPSAPLFLLAPNILELERHRRLPAADFRLWVCVHEQTHALQFSAAPWLREHLLQHLAGVVLDERASDDGALTRITATMTLLEGHADFVSDEVGRRHIPSVRRLRQAFRRQGERSWPMRLLPALDKDAQYRDGLAFCRQVAARVGARGLTRAFEGPDQLPTPAELADPPTWVRRVHGRA